MKNLILLVALSVLFGCASQKRSDKEIYMDAATQYASMLPKEQSSMSFPGVKIPSHGFLADSVAIASGGGANALNLKRQLLAAKSSGNFGFLIIGSNSALDFAVIEGATEAQDLSGMSIFYAGKSESDNKVRLVIERSRAKFYYIDSN